MELLHRRLRPTLVPPKNRLSVKGIWVNGLDVKADLKVPEIAD